MLQLVGLSKTFGHRVVFDRVSLMASPAQRIGLVGPAGSGKTTLLRMILGLESYEGRICIAPFTWFGYVPQIPIPVGDFTFDDVMATAREDCVVLRSRFEDAPPGYPAPLARTTPSPRQIQDAISGALHLERLSPRTRMASLQAAEQNRVWLASLLLAHPDVLVIDDPASTFSPSLMLELGDCLRGFSGLVILAAADPSLLMGLVDTFWEIKPGSCGVESYLAPGTRRSSPAHPTLTAPNSSRLFRVSAG